jgi:hypothetical protein
MWRTTRRTLRARTRPGLGDVAFGVRGPSGFGVLGAAVVAAAAGGLGAAAVLEAPTGAVSSAAGLFTGGSSGRGAGGWRGGAAGAPGVVASSTRSTPPRNVAAEGPVSPARGLG